MAIAYDNSLNTVVGTSSGIASYSYTVSGLNMGLLVGVLVDSGGICTGVTYGGVAMTLIAQQVTSGFSGFRNYLYYLSNPPTGSNTVVISNTGTTISSSAASYSGVKQTGQPSVLNTSQTSGSNTNTTSTTTLSANNWLVEFVVSTNVNITAGSGTVSRMGSGNYGFADTGLAVTPASSYSLVIQTTFNSFWNVIQVSIEPSITLSNGAFLMNFI